VSAAVNQALGDLEVREKMRAQFYEPRPGSAESFASFVRSESVKWTKTIREANIKAD
jgi:tripartite-type tricarboxylate transporter receptor subunit TctC